MKCLHGDDKLGSVRPRLSLCDLGASNNAGDPKRTIWPAVINSYKYKYELFYLQALSSKLDVVL